MSSDGIIGQVLDGKYSIERQLGKGGMGTVYLSTHIGTGRPVAVKVIAPDFMKRAEFVERFRREAKAAGRLRHPNVVDVTDFGFSRLKNGEDAAYLVMEYLDGCTLGEVLDEEKKLPVSFIVDILEQVCSAVEEAHKQGIIHRDLKPDNIWLEPNLRGGYTVKVLDFGIAKLEEAQLEEIADSAEIPYLATSNTNVDRDKATIADGKQSATISDKNKSTIVSENETMAMVDESNTLAQGNSESGTMIQGSESEADSDSEAGTQIIQPIQPKRRKEVSLEDGTAILPSNQTQAFEKEDSKGTKIITADGEDTNNPSLISSSTTNLTRVGAVLGTPLYMSPEQCRGEKLTAHSDIYSLAVIAYQMIEGKLPFTGDYVKVMDGHKNETPPLLKAKKVPKKLKGTVLQSLSKSIEDRPVSAEAFANKVRANSEGIGSLLRRSLVIYSQNLPKILQLTFLAFLPIIILFVLKIVSAVIIGFELMEDTSFAKWMRGGIEFVYFFAIIFVVAFLVGMMTWLVAQYLAFPLRPLSLKSAFKELKKRAGSLSLTVGFSTIVSMIGYAFCLLPGLYISIRFMMITPSIMMEGISGKAAIKRSMELTKRSFRTLLAAALLVYVVPGIGGVLVGSVVALANGTYTSHLKANKMEEKMDLMKKEGVQPQAEDEIKKAEEEKNGDFNVNIGINGNKVVINDSSSEDKLDKEYKKKAGRFYAITDAISQPILLLLITLSTSFTSVITALLYFKTRQAGGESMQELLGKLDDTDEPQSKWQQRVRERLIQSGKITGSTTNPSKPGS